MTERELCHELFDECRKLLRYDGIDPVRVRQAVDAISDIIAARQRMIENDELDDE